MKNNIVKVLLWDKEICKLQWDGGYKKGFGKVGAHISFPAELSFRTLFGHTALLSLVVLRNPLCSPCGTLFPHSLWAHCSLSIFAFLVHSLSLQVRRLTCHAEAVRP